jgi:tRNA-uridine 2-sulfurtransferase
VQTHSVTKKRVAVGLSGGVDSSVAAYLLAKRGYEITGVFIQCWDARADGCKSDEDRKYAIETATKLGIKFVQLDFRKQYKSKVIKYFYEEYEAGRTPNPDVMCNKEIKFGLFYDWAMKNGFDYVATGHYARVKELSGGRYKLLKGVDPGKDQTYFLYVLNQEQLGHVLFPVGGLLKSKVREIAKKQELPSAKRAESMGICFIGEVDIKKFLKAKLPEKVGRVLDLAGEIIGSHDGAWFYTIGQRHGFKLNTYFGHPMYVISKDAKKNVLVVGEEKDAYTKEFTVGNLHWLNADPFESAKTFDCDVRIRHLGELHKALVTKMTGERARIVLKTPVFAVAPGQSVVLYHGAIVSGGGIIA